MTYSAGLDVSLKETAICVIDETGRIVRELRAVSEPTALGEALGRVGLPLERIGLEACSLSSWLHDGLREAGLEAILIETRQAEPSSPRGSRNWQARIGQPWRWSSLC